MIFQPHEYQQRAIDFVEKQRKALLFLDMGLGKTAITLTAINNLFLCGEISKVLVIAPRKVAETTWQTEAAKWEHTQGLRVVSLLGTPKQRAEALTRKAEVWVISRDSFSALVDMTGKDFPFDMVVIDELTSFKTRSSVRFKSFRKIRPLLNRIVGLTGTPAPNGLQDLWAQTYCIDGGERLGKFYTKFQEEYFNAYVRNHIVLRLTPKPDTEKRIHEKLKDIAITMQASDYLRLPDLIVNDVSIPLPEHVMRDYLKFERESILVYPWEATLLAENAAALSVKLSQFANGVVYAEDDKVQAIHTAKAEWLDSIREYVGENILCFYQFKHDIDQIKRFMLGKSIRVYETPQDLEDWNAGKIEILLAHPASTAYGLNLQYGGSVIVWFGLGWNLELYQQANARLHRQGQTKPVRVFRLLAQGTIDERAASALDGKRDTQQAMLDYFKQKKEEYATT